MGGSRTLQLLKDATKVFSSQAAYEQLSRPRKHLIKVRCPGHKEQVQVSIQNRFYKAYQRLSLKTKSTKENGSHHPSAARWRLNHRHCPLEDTHVPSGWTASLAGNGDMLTAWQCGLETPTHGKERYLSTKNAKQTRHQNLSTLSLRVAKTPAWCHLQSSVHTPQALQCKVRPLKPISWALSSSLTKPHVPIPQPCLE